jgi:hypothetical protein
MFDLVAVLPVEPLIDVTLRYGGGVVSNRYSQYAILISLANFIWSYIRWRRQKEYGKLRDRKDREQDSRLNALQHVSMNIQFIKSPNYWIGRRGRSTKKIIDHSMAGYLEPSIREFQNTSREASANFLVGNDGRIVQMVEIDNTAWHAGVNPFSWYAITHPSCLFNNTDTIGIEHEGGKIKQPDGSFITIPFSDAGYAASAELHAWLHRLKSWGRPVKGQTMDTHGNVAPTECPTGLDHDRLVRESQAAYDRLTQPQVDPVQAPTPVVQNTSKPSFDKGLIGKDFSCTVEINRRKGGGLNGGLATEPYETLLAGTTIQLSGNYSSADGYTWVELLGGGWVAKEMLADATPVPKSVIVTTAPGVVANVRGTASPSGKFIGSFKSGASVQYSEVVDGVPVLGNNKWLHLLDGNYMWSGCTNYK